VGLLLNFTGKVEYMSKQKIWSELLDGVDEVVNTNVKLTENDEAIIRGSVDAVLKNIFRREKDPLKRRILISKIIETTVFETSHLSTLKMYNVRRHQLRENKFVKN
jgi:hypothetical protein